MAAKFRHGYALIIGVDEHSVLSWQLPTVEKDVNALHQLLINPERCGYPDENVKLIRGKEATKQGIEAGLTWLLDKVSDDADSTAIIYYSGHGARIDDGRYFLVPYDVKRYDLLPIQGFSAARFAETIALIDPPRLLAVLDCCYAAGMEVKGAAFPINASADKKALADGAREIDFNPLKTGGGRFILNSSTGMETSLIRSDRKMSVFTYHLIDALNGKGRTNDDTTVLVTDVIQHVVRTVPQTAAEHNNHSQNPYIRSEGVGFPIALLLGGKGLPKNVNLPDPLSDPVIEAATTTINVGSGAAAVGESAVAAGERGVAAGGNISGSTIITGDSNRLDRSSSVFNQREQTVYGDQTNVAGDVEQLGDRHEQTIRTEGGAYIGGNVSTGGDFVGRDKVVQGDEVRGDKVMGDKVGGDKIDVGNISGSTGIAIGRGARTSVTQGMGGQDASSIAQLFESIYPIIEQTSQPPAIQAVLKQQVQTIEEEAMRGEQADERKIEDAFIVIKSMAPRLLEVVVNTLANPGLRLPMKVKMVSERMRG